MITRFPPIALALFVTAGLPACGGDVSTSSVPSAIVDPEDSAFIIDGTGKRWDVGHGSQYGLDPRGYEAGLGPFAIRPIRNPQMLGPGDEGYPSAASPFPILGVFLNGFARAYPLAVMYNHEVANEVFGETHVAVTF